MQIPCTCGCDRNVCVDCMQDHIDSLHDNLHKLVDEMEIQMNNQAQTFGYICATIEWKGRIKQLLEIERGG